MSWGLNRPVNGTTVSRTARAVDALVVVGAAVVVAGVAPAHPFRPIDTAASTARPRNIRFIRVLLAAGRTPAAGAHRMDLEHATHGCWQGDRFGGVRRRHVELVVLRTVHALLVDG